MRRLSEIIFIFMILLFCSELFSLEIIDYQIHIQNYEISQPQISRLLSPEILQFQYTSHCELPEKDSVSYFIFMESLQKKLEYTVVSTESWNTMNLSLLKGHILQAINNTFTEQNLLFPHKFQFQFQQQDSEKIRERTVPNFLSIQCLIVYSLNS